MDGLQVNMLNALVRLDVEGVKQGLECRNANVGNLDDMVSIPVAWDWMIGDPKSWSDGVGMDYRKRNDEIKELLSDRFSVDWNNIPEKLLPHSIVKDSLECLFSASPEDLFDFDWETMITRYRKQDVELFVEAERLELDRVEALLKQGANPYVELCDGENIIDIVESRSASGEIELNHYVAGDCPDDYPPSEAYSKGCWTLIRSAAYERVYRMLTNH